MNRFLPAVKIITVIFLEEQLNLSPSPITAEGAVESNYNGEAIFLVRINFPNLIRICDYSLLQVADEVVRSHFISTVYFETHKYMLDEEAGIYYEGISGGSSFWRDNLEIIQADKVLYYDYILESVNNILAGMIMGSSKDEKSGSMLFEIMDILRERRHILESHKKLTCFMCGKPLAKEIKTSPDNFIGLVLRIREGEFSSPMLFCSFSCREIYYNMKNLVG